jgi:2-polyprenyl-6-methoxyphenol hydroxylase-like FAD-dependent oxidoreductase
VFERRASTTDMAGVGGVLMLSPNAVNVLDKIMGVEPDIRPLGFTYKAIEMHATSGSEPMYKLGDFGRSKEGDAQGLTIKRPVLHAKLLELCQLQKEFITVQFGKRLVDVKEDAVAVTAVFDDGTTATGESRGRVILPMACIVGHGLCTSGPCCCPCWRPGPS